MHQLKCTAVHVSSLVSTAVILTSCTSQAAKAVVFGGKAAAAGGVAFLVLGKPLRTLRWAWTIVSRLALFAGLMATYM